MVLRILDRPVLRVAFFGGFGLLCFLLSLALTLPTERLKQIIEVQAESALGHKYKVTITELSLWRLSGVELHNMVLQERWTDEEFAEANRSTPKDAPPLKPPRIVIPRAGVRFAPLTSIINLGPAGAFLLDFEEGGSIEGTVVYGAESKIHAELVDLDLMRSKLFTSLTGVPAFGDMVGTVDLVVDKRGSVIGGELDLKGKKLTLGPGTIKPRPMTFLDIPSTNFGNLTFKAKIERPKGGVPVFKFEEFEAQGRDIRMQTWGDIRLGRALGSSTFNVKMRLQFDQDFIKEHSLGQLLTAQYFRDGKGADGWYGFSLNGPIRQRSFRGDRLATRGPSPGADDKNGGTTKTPSKPPTTTTRRSTVTPATAKTPPPGRTITTPRGRITTTRRPITPVGTDTPKTPNVDPPDDVDEKVEEDGESPTDSP